MPGTSEWDGMAKSRPDPVLLWCPYQPAALLTAHYDLPHLAYLMHDIMLGTVSCTPECARISCSAHKYNPSAATSNVNILWPAIDTFVVHSDSLSGTQYLDIYVPELGPD